MQKLDNLWQGNIKYIVSDLYKTLQELIIVSNYNNSLSKMNAIIFVLLVASNKFQSDKTNRNQYVFKHNQFSPDQHTACLSRPTKFLLFFSPFWTLSDAILKTLTLVLHSCLEVGIGYAASEIFFYFINSVIHLFI